MFRRAQILRTTIPKIERVALREVENKHIAVVVGVFVGGFGLLRYELKADIKEAKDSMNEMTAELKAKMNETTAELKAKMNETTAELKAKMNETTAELKADINALSAEIRAALSAMNTSKGAMDAHAQFYRDVKGGCSSAGGLN